MYTLRYARVLGNNRSVCDLLHLIPREDVVVGVAPVTAPVLVFAFISDIPARHILLVALARSRKVPYLRKFQKKKKNKPHVRGGTIERIWRKEGGGVTLSVLSLDPLTTRLDENWSV